VEDGARRPAVRWFAGGGHQNESRTTSCRSGGDDGAAGPTVHRVESAVLQATREGGATPPAREGPLPRGGVASRRVGRAEKEELCRQGGPVGGRWRAATGTSGSPNPEPTGFLDKNGPLYRSNRTIYQ
jgi:hypothetical protein